MNRETPQYKLWRANIYARDGWKCRLCDSKEKIEAHHIYPIRTHEYLALEISNGITLCFKCHRTIFGKEIKLANIFKNLLKNSVNSVNILPGNAEDNTEPNQGRNSLKGVTTRSRSYSLEQFEKKEVKCSECDTMLVRHYYRTQRSKRFWCSKACSKLWLRKNWKGKNNPSYKELEKSICLFCGKETPKTPTYKHRKKKYCNNSCQLRYEYKNGLKKKRQPYLNGKWAKEYTECLICHKTDKRHYGKGKCMSCYNKIYNSKQS